MARTVADKQDTMRVEINGVCPCGGTFSAGYIEADGDPAVMHSKPVCKEFEAKEIDEYLYWIRTREQS